MGVKFCSWGFQQNLAVVKGYIVKALVTVVCLHEVNYGQRWVLNFVPGVFSMCKQLWPGSVSTKGVMRDSLSVHAKDIHVFILFVLNTSWS